MNLFVSDYTQRTISQTLDASGSHIEVPTLGQKLDVVLTQETNQASYFSARVEGCVCACNYTDSGLVSKVLDEAIHCKAVALLTVTTPLTNTNFPVFVVDGFF